MDLAGFLALDDAAAAAALQAGADPCWAIAMGGTRRAYIAQGGALRGPDDLSDYVQWAEAAQCAVLDQVAALGVQTIIAVVRLPGDRGPAYQAMARGALAALATAAPRRELYARRRMRVSATGDLPAIAAALAGPELQEQLAALAAHTAAAAGPRLIYLFRGPWVDPAVEEAQFGYRVGRELGRSPSRAELVRAYYGDDAPPLTVYVGSGRPRLGQLRPPFLGGDEDLYWAQAPLMRLRPETWRRIAYDHLWSRRTHSARDYAADPDSRRALVRSLAAVDGQVVGVGARHPLGFWQPGDQVDLIAADGGSPA